MRRSIAVLLVMATLTAVALTAAVSAGAESGPRCADITGEGHIYTVRGTLSFGLLLDGAADPTLATPCKSVTYTLTISGITGGPLVISQKGDSTFNATFSDTDDNICVSATTSSSGGKVHDAAPNAGCLEVSVGPSGGGSGFS